MSRNKYQYEKHRIITCVENLEVCLKNDLDLDYQQITFYKDCAD